MNRYGSIDIGGFVEYMSNLGKMARLGYRFSPEELLSGNPYKVEKPDMQFVDEVTEESAITGENSFRVVWPYEDLKFEKATPEMTEAEKNEIIKWNLIKIVEHEINMKKREDMQFEHSRDISMKVNPLDPDYKPEFWEILEKEMIEDSIMARLMGKESELDDIDRYLL